MSVRVTSNRLLNEMEVKNRTGLALRFMLDAIQEQATPFTPKRLGNLRADVVKQVVGTRGMIGWEKKYAGRMEKDETIVHYTTPGTGPHYAENAVKIVTEKAPLYFRKAGLNGR
jgi:hypothetical protein